MRIPHGAWPSPLTAAMVAAQGVRLSGAAVDGDDIYWIEGRPAEGGRNVLVRRRPDGTCADAIPAGFDARTRVHEYGGGAFVAGGGAVYFSNFTDQRLYRAGDPPQPITPAGPWRYADGVLTPGGSRLVCVREDHSGGGEPANTLVSIALDAPASAGTVIASGHDFYACPRLSPDGSRLAWIAWNHPNMPWDGTQLWVADVGPDGTLHHARCVAGGAADAIYQPGWSPDGVLYFVSDREGWWRLYRMPVLDAGASRIEPVLPTPPPETEFGRPQWIFGTATWAFASPDTIVTASTCRGRWRLGRIDVAAGRLVDLDLAWEPRDWLAVQAGHAVFIGGSDTSLDAVLRVDAGGGVVEVLRPAGTIPLDPGMIARPEPIVFGTTGGAAAHAFYYPPTRAQCRAPEGERPPVIVISHGGPTAATAPTLDLKVQFWTTRGFGVLDVNYRGSTGYGRAYRGALDGAWGIADVEDVIAGARFLVEQGKADPARLAIRGGSAGGYTTLAALTFHPGVFAAGASYYGVSDLEILARDTHKFESRYLDRLVGPYPEAAETYRARSPIRAVDRLACPLILFQGSEDRVVPPNQSELMADAVRRNGWPVALLLFAGEQHGFRRAATTVRCLEAELAFYGAVFGFSPADDLPPLAIDNPDRLPPRP